MGNTFSLSKENHENKNKNDMTNTSSLIEYIDMVATNYILTQSMMDMMRFTDKEYYDNMIILTSYIMKNQLSSLDVGILKERVLNGINHNNNNTENNSVYFANTNELKEITLNNERKKEKALLIISKFYVKIMTIFSAITAIIDPQYVYEDENGEKQYFFLKDYDSYIKLDTKTKHLKINQLDNPIGFIKKRLAILKNKMSPANNESEDYILLNPGEKFCQKDENNKSLTDEIGIKELDALYYDMYDYEENKWTKRSDFMQKKYDEDLVLFYQIFTGNKEKPDTINSFSDIESLDFHNLKRCINKDFFEDLLISNKDHLFIKYMEKVEMIQSITKTYKKKLLYIMKQIFVPSNENKETYFMISPTLTMEMLLSYQDEVKKNINSIYTNCERLFIEALLLYEKMYENQHGELTENQIQSIKQPSNVLDENSLNKGLTNVENSPINNSQEEKTSNDSISNTAEKNTNSSSNKIIQQSNTLNEINNTMSNQINTSESKTNNKSLDIQEKQSENELKNEKNTLETTSEVKPLNSTDTANEVRPLNSTTSEVRPLNSTTNEVSNLTDTTSEVSNEVSNLTDTTSEVPNLTDTTSEVSNSMDKINEVKTPNSMDKINEVKTSNSIESANVVSNSMESANLESRNDVPNSTKITNGIKSPNSIESTNMKSINTPNNNKLNNVINQPDYEKTNENSTKVTNTESPQTTIENIESPNQSSLPANNNPPQEPANQNKKAINNPPSQPVINNPPQVNQNKKVINNSPQKNNLYFETPQTPATTVGGSEGFFSNIRSGINQILGGD